jgi:hypothetical protein
VFLLSGDINLSIRGESDGGLLDVINGLVVLILIIVVTNPGTFRRYSNAGASGGLVKPSYRQQYLWF